MNFPIFVAISGCLVDVFDQPQNPGLIMNFLHTTLRFRALSILALLILNAACSDSSSPPVEIPAEIPAEIPVVPTYQASVVRTSYGIPHVTASDWGGLGYGYGYAFAQDNYCVLMKEVL
ncbi:MAG: acyl-homoserine-lactone acylase, partial [Halieaceae bacterium]